LDLDICFVVTNWKVTVGVGLMICRVAVCQCMMRIVGYGFVGIYGAIKVP
jgi:hypothetical protein